MTSQSASRIGDSTCLPLTSERGNFVKPTAFANVKPEMKIAREEIFGPVFSILTYKTEADAIRIANDSEFGLMA